MRSFMMVMLAVVALTFVGCGEKPEEHGHEAGTEAHEHGEEVQGEHQEGTEEGEHEEGHEGEHEESQQGQEDEQAALYVCPNHPEMTSNKPDSCPQCGTFLKIEREKAPEKGQVGHEHG